MKKKLFISSIVVLSALALFFSACEKQWPQIEEGKFVKVIYDKGVHVHAGDKITFFYRPRTEPPTAFRMSITYQDLSTETRCLDFEVKDGVYKSSFVTPDSVMSLYVFPIGDGQQPVPISFTVHDEREHPVRGARGDLAVSWWVGGSTIGDSLFREELAENPDMVMFYRTHWFRNSFSDEKKEALRREVDSLAAFADSNAQIYGVVASGYAIIGELDKALEAMEKYLEIGELHPEIAPTAASDLKTYSSIYEKKDRSRELEIYLQMAIKFPAHRISEYYVQSAIWGKDNAGSRDSIAEAIIEARIAEDPSTYYLKSEYFDGIGDTVTAIDAAEAYAKAIESGAIPWCDWSVPDEAPPMFMRLAENDYNGSNFKSALSRAKSAIEYSEDENMIGEFYAFCAKCNVAMKQTEQAKKDIIEAVVRGAVPQAKELLPEIYPDVDPVEALKLVFEEASALAPESPRFAIVTMDDDTVAPGEVILCLDFWNPGCGPCVAEMPLLSAFAKDHVGEGIRFLSVSAAPKEHFETTAYPLENWTLCPSNRQAFIDMKVAAIPHFFLVDARGRIRYNQIGAPVDTASVAALLELLATEREVAGR